MFFSLLFSFLFFSLSLSHARRPFIPTPTPATPSPTPTPVTPLDRPKVVTQSLRFLNQTVFNVPHNVAISELEFDQDLYMMQSFLCGYADSKCPPLTNECVPCDWTSPQSDACSDPNCCFDGTDQERASWCDTSAPYDVITINSDKSEEYTLAAGESRTFRFFLPASQYCRPFILRTETSYGTAVVYLSRIDPNPGPSSYQWIKDSSQYTFGLCDIHVCPIIHPDYSTGTYAFTVQAVTGLSFAIQIPVSPQTYPIPKPASRALCSDVPESEILPLQENNASMILCFEDSISYDVIFPSYMSSLYAEIIMPVDPGCHTIALSVNMRSTGTDADLFCFPTVNGSPVTLYNSMRVHWNVGDDVVVFAGCFESVTYIHCAAQAWQTGPITFIWSSTSKPLYLPIQDVLAGDLTNNIGLGGAGMFPLGSFGTPCPDNWNDCYNWITYPTTDPMVLWPPPSQIEKFDIPFNATPLARAVSRGLASPLSRKVIVVQGLRIGSKVLYDDVSFMETAVLFINNIVGATGLPLSLNGRRSESRRTDVSSFLFNVRVSELDIVVNTSSLCRYGDFLEISSLVSDDLTEILNADSLSAVQPHRMAIACFNALTTQTSCLEGAEELMESAIENVTLVDQTYCRYDQESQSDLWSDDVCCNLNRLAIDCCLPFNVYSEESLFDSANTALVDNECGTPTCATSYVNDLTLALKNQADPIQGCSSGIKNTRGVLSLAVYLETERVVRACLVESGLGEMYVGVTCAQDSDCSLYEGVCDMTTKVCALANLSDVSNAYLRCYLSKISSSTEYYIRHTILPDPLTSYSRDSPEFFSAVRIAASVPDCVNPSDALDISRRTKYEWVWSSIECVTQLLELNETDVFGRNYSALVEDVCPPRYCLDTSCLMPADQCYIACSASYALTSSDESQCDVESCPFDGTPCDNKDVCAYCVDGDCIVHPNSSSLVLNDCTDAFVCELPDGTFEFGLTESQCVTKDASCSARCVGESCYSYQFGDGGACFVPAADEPSCDDYGVSQSVGVTFYEGVCVIAGVDDASTCASYPTASFQTCTSIPLSSCNGSTPTQVYLQCFVDKWRECVNAEECEGSGVCSDRAWTQVVESLNPFVVRDGACFDSGFWDGSLSRPFCFPTQDQPPIGCRDPDFDQSTCKAFEVTNQGYWYWRTWLTPALTESQCVTQDFGRYGCLFPEYPELHLYWYNETSCDCAEGVMMNAWQWTSGQWRGGQVRKMEKVVTTVTSEYVWDAGALSFMNLLSWLESSVEIRILYGLKSESLCSWNVIESNLFSVTCDCLSPDSPQNSTCYTSTSFGDASLDTQEVLMGSTSACQGEETSVKDPSAVVTFNTSSVLDGCVFANVSIVYQGWFAAPYVPPPLSFRWQNAKVNGVVVNAKKAKVGSLLGDGLALTLSDPSIVGTIHVCLLISDTRDEEAYPVADFGYSTNQYQYIYPMNLSNVVQVTVVQSTFWCSYLNISDSPIEDGTLRLYPIERVSDYSTVPNEYTSEQTKVLMYVLGAFYSFIAFLCVVALILLQFTRDINIVTKSKQTSKAKKKAQASSVPIVFTVIFLILCIFRACYMFLYPQGSFENNSLAAFVVFEIPTFLLFTLVMYAIYVWHSLCFKGFNIETQDLGLVLGVSFVWSIWIIVTVVYAEVIVNNTVENVCPGRAEPSYSSVSEQTRTLTIAYQSTLIGVTAILVAIFFFFSVKLINSAKRIAAVKQFLLIVGGVIVVSFLLRCILFVIILAADFVSSIYLFITLFITEIIPMFVLLFQFNHFRVSVAISKTSGSKTSGSQTAASELGSDSSKSAQ